ncbi:MAG TPA: TetR/AcrR family transcriptional regulator [Ruminococcaceae bacterium]|nr:TetR/AcrR family transcriptional regulator [Oscillospiraceae bacterium]
MAYTQKTNLTRTKIQKAFLDILADKKFELITINDIVKKAEINRSSFYRYYEDKYALLSEIEDRILAHMQECRQEQEISQKTSQVDGFTEILLSLNEYATAIDRLLSVNGDSTFEIKLRKEITKKFYSHLRVTEEDAPRAFLIKEFLTTIIIRTFKYWTSGEAEMSAHELASLIMDISLHGFAAAVSNSIPHHDQ